MCILTGSGCCCWMKINQINKQCGWLSFWHCYEHRKNFIVYSKYSQSPQYITLVTSTLRNLGDFDNNLMCNAHLIGDLDDICTLSVTLVILPGL